MIAEKYDEGKYDGPSKSQLKRERHALIDLGVKLCKLPPKQYKSLNIESDKLSYAISQAKEIYSNIAAKRQRQFIGKVISKLEDDEIQSLKDQIEKIENQATLANKNFHLLEVYRDRLIKEGDKEINELMQKYSNLDRTHLRQLVRNALKEKKLEKPPKSARLIYKYLQQNIKF